jgi:hypothetical protein
MPTGQAFEMAVEEVSVAQIMTNVYPETLLEVKQLSV